MVVHTSQLRLAYVFRLAIGSALVVAAILKAESLVLNVDRSHSTIRLPVAVIYAGATTEFALGCWLLSGPLTVASTIVAIGVFLVFASLSFYQLIANADVCGCFGMLALPPLNVLLFDLMVLCGLTIQLSQRLKVSAGKFRRRASHIAFLACTIGSVSSLVFVASELWSHARARIAASIPSTDEKPNDIIAKSLSPNLGLLFPSFPPELIVQANRISATALPAYVTDVLKLAQLESKYRLMPLQMGSRNWQDAAEFPLIVSRLNGKCLVILGEGLCSESRCFTVVEGGAPPRVVELAFVESIAVQVWKIIPENDANVTQMAKFRLGDSTLEVTPRAVIFGLSEPFTSRSTTFKLSNAGPVALKFDAVRVTCGCLNVTALTHEMHLAPGEEVSIDAKIDIQDMPFRQAAIIEVRNVASGERIELPLELLGGTEESLRVSTKQLDLGTSDDSGPISRKILLREVSTDRFAITNVECDGVDLHWSVKTNPYDDGLMSYEIEVTFPSAQLWRLAPAGIIKISTTSKRVPVVEVSYVTKGGGFLNARPGTLAFGRIQVGRKMTAKTSVKTPPCEGCIFAADFIDNGNFSVLKVSKVAPNEWDVLVALDTGGAGLFSSSLLIRLIDRDKCKQLVVPCSALVIDK